MPEVLADRSNIPWHGELYAIENAMMVHFNDVINQYIHGNDEPIGLLLSPQPWKCYSIISFSLIFDFAFWVGSQIASTHAGCFKIKEV